MIKAFNKQYYQREREAKGILHNNEDNNHVEHDVITGLMISLKPVDNDELEKVDSDSNDRGQEMESFVGDWIKHKNPKNHKQLGNGEIVEHNIEEYELDKNEEKDEDEIRLSVKFEKKDKLIKISVKNLLAKYDPIEGLDSHIQNYIEERRQRHTCDLCGSYDEDIVSFRDSKLCNSCHDKLAVCEHCRRRFYDNEIVHDDTTGEIQCKECYNRTHVTCIECKKVVPRHRAWEYWEAERYLCDSCYYSESKLYYNCNKCFKPVKNDLVIIVPWKSLDFDESLIEEEVCLCPSCASNYIICERCGSSFIPKSTERICKACNEALLHIAWVKRLKIETLKGEYWSERRLRKEGTTEVMSRLKNQSKKYDYLDYFEVLYIPSYDYIQGKSHTLLVVYFEKYDEIMLYDDTQVLHFLDATMTDLVRKHPSYLIQAIRGKTKNAKERIILNNIRYFSRGQVFTIWDKPIILRAVTNFDKNYGDRYDDSGFRMGIGNQYGDTSYFMIIGTLSDK